MSVSSELSKRQMGRFICEVRKVRVMEMGLWSDKNMGSIVVTFRSVRSFCERKK